MAAAESLTLSPKAVARLQGWRDDLPTFASENLWVADKVQRVVPLRYNAMQLQLHEAIQRQKEETGKVRAIILKARQLGASTYLASRMYHALYHKRAHAYVLAHSQRTAHLLGRMIGLMHERHDEALRHPAMKANDELRTWSNGSLYEVHTASTPQGGRGGTAAYYHSSETAYHEHLQAHQLGSAQQVSENPTTEMYYESTAAGQTGGFYEMYRAAKQGRSEFEAMFFSWMLDPAYAAEVPIGFTLTTDKPNDYVPSERDYAQQHGCTMEQMAWRRIKIASLSQAGGDGTLYFAQEYPADADEAFGGLGLKTLLNPLHVQAAMRRPITITAQERAHPLMVGVDPATSHGPASTAIAWRYGNICPRLQRLRGLDPDQLAEWLVREVFHKYNVATMLVDRGEGVGDHLVTHLNRRPECAGKVHGVYFGGDASDRGLWLNKRAECWGTMAQWFARGAAIPREVAMDGRPTLDTELLAPGYDWQSERRLRIEAKDAMRKRGVPSPDGADALALTFALPEPIPGDSMGYHQVEAPFTIQPDVSFGFEDQGGFVAETGGWM